MSLAPGLAVCRPRKPKQALLWQVLFAYFDSFEQSYEGCCIKTYGFFRSVVSRVIWDWGQEIGTLRK